MFVTILLTQNIYIEFARQQQYNFGVIVCKTVEHTV